MCKVTKIVVLGGWFVIALIINHTVNKISSNLSVTY